METDLPVINLIVNHPRRAVWEGLLASFQPAMRPPDLNFEWRIEGQQILFQFSPWGNIGFFNFEGFNTITSGNSILSTSLSNSTRN